MALGGTLKAPVQPKTGLEKKKGPHSVSQAQQRQRYRLSVDVGAQKSPRSGVPRAHLGEVWHDVLPPPKPRHHCVGKRCPAVSERPELSPEMGGRRLFWNLERGTGVAAYRASRSDNSACRTIRRHNSQPVTLLKETNCCHGGLTCLFIACGVQQCCIESSF